MKRLILLLCAAAVLIAQTAMTSNPSFPGYFTLTDGATITWNIGSVSLSSAKVTLGGNRTLNVSNPAEGGVYLLKIIQDATGSRTLTLGTCGAGAFKVINGGSGAVTLTTAATSVDYIAFTYDGSNCFANIGKNYN